MAAGLPCATQGFCGGTEGVRAVFGRDGIDRVHQGCAASVIGDTDHTKNIGL